MPFIDRCTKYRNNNKEGQTASYEACIEAVQLAFRHDSHAQAHVCSPVHDCYTEINQKKHTVLELYCMSTCK